MAAAESHAGSSGWGRAFSRWPLVFAMICAGVSHFVWWDLYQQMVPPWLPARLAAVLVSGGLLITLGALLIPRRTRLRAGWGLIVLFVMMLPANLHMALHEVRLQGAPSWFPHLTAAQAWARVGAQPLFVAWAYWACRAARE